MGATNFFTSYNADMGLIGSIILFYMIGLYMGNLYRKKESSGYLNNTIYCMVSSCLMFTFFRDSVGISLVKNIFEFSVLIPFILAVVNTTIVKHKGLML